jgi:hypothetical protein
MLDDTLEMDEDEELEEEADAEVDKVLFELTNGKLGEARPAVTDLPVRILLCVVLSLRWLTVIPAGARQGRRGRDGESDGAIPTTAERSAQLIMYTTGLDTTHI